MTAATPMLQTTLRRRGLPTALLAALAAAGAVGLYTASAVARLEPASPVAPISLLCQLVGPPLPALGAAVAPAALAVMAPCLLQLTGVLVAATAGLAAIESAPPWRTAMAFGSGFLGVYALAAIAVAALGPALAPIAPLLQAAGGLMLALLGLAVLRVLPRRVLAGCRGPRWLILTGRANLRRPVGAGAAFAVYCLGCCGPFLAGLALLGAGAGSPLGGAALVLAFAMVMGALLLLPLVAAGASARFQAALRAHGGPIALAAGAALVGLGVAIALEPALLAALTH